MNNSTDTVKPAESRLSKAPESCQEVAFIKAQILKRFESFIATHKGELGLKGARSQYADLFNRGLTEEDLAAKWRSTQERHNRSRKVQLSAHTLWRWQSRLSKQGMAGLCEQYNNGGLRTDPDAQAYIQRLIWDNHLASFKDIYDDLALLVFKEKMPSLPTVTRLAKAYRQEHWAALVKKHEGTRGLRDRNMLPALGRADADLVEPLERWELDSTLADLFTEREVKDVFIRTSDGKRCKVIGVIDVYSRLPKFHLTEHESSLAVGLAIKDGILNWGVPGEIRIDNGRPFKNKRVLDFMRGIGVSVHICLPGNPVEKPTIERVFRTLSESFFRRLEGYSGNCVANRPNEIRVKYTMFELQDLMDRWVTNVYAETVHSSTGQRPRERMAKPGFVPSKINEQDLEILLMEVGDRIVSQGCVRYQGGEYFHPKLPEGCKVKLRINDFDASEVLVYFKGQFLCRAEDVRRKGLSRKEIHEAKKERSRELTAVIKTNEALLSRHDTSKAGIVNLINSREKDKPFELPRKAEVLSFPALTEPVIDDVPEVATMKECEAPRPIRNNQEFYLHLMKKIRSGQDLNAREDVWLSDYRESNEFRMVGSYLDDQLQRGHGG